jgi:hypothetical protein
VARGVVELDVTRGQALDGLKARIARWLTVISE